MGQEPPVHRRIVTVTNPKIFDEPGYNCTDQFPYVWDEISLPIRYSDDRSKAESILLGAARRHALRSETMERQDLDQLQQSFGITGGEIDPRVYWRLTDNWLELTVRFLALDHGTREIKDAMSREVLAGFDAAKIGIASATYEIVGIPPLKLEGGEGG